jgi:hypothetical protein
MEGLKQLTSAVQEKGVEIPWCYRAYSQILTPEVMVLELKKRRTEKTQCLAIWTTCMHCHRSVMYSPINVTSFICSVSLQ